MPMSKLERIKEHIGALKTYLAIIMALILAFGTGVIKLFIEQQTGLLFWLGSLIVLVLIVLFAVIAKSMHTNIEQLEEL